MAILKKLQILAKEFKSKYQRETEKHSTAIFHLLANHPNIEKAHAINKLQMNLHPRNGISKKDLTLSLRHHLAKHGYKLHDDTDISYKGKDGQRVYSAVSLNGKRSSEPYISARQYKYKGIPDKIYKKYDPNKDIKKVKGVIPTEALQYPESHFFKHYEQKQHADLEGRHIYHVHKNMTANDKAAVGLYSKDSAYINHHLRENKPIPSKAELTEKPNNLHDNFHDTENDTGSYDYKHLIPSHIHHLDSAISKGTAHKPLTVFRGLPEHVAHKMQPGNVVKKRAYTSTSISAEKAASFGDSHLMHLRIPKGHHIAYVPPLYPKHEEEKEVLLPRDTHVRIDHKEIINGKHIIHATVLKRKLKHTIEAKFNASN